ncbi:MAG: glycosyltransferase [Hyphomicrobiaceae bacterium]|nr:glycosyltransferase [Hyphomicrobiaceae bacterium]
MLDPILNLFRGVLSHLIPNLKRDGTLRLGRYTVVSSNRWDVLRNQAAELEGQKSLLGSKSESKRSAVFLHNAYYNFLYLAEALRERGWDAISVCVEDPKSPSYNFYHGEDRNLFDADPDCFAQNLSDFLGEIPQRFRMLHFYGIGRMALHPDRFDGSGPHLNFDRVPWDFLAFKKMGMKIGYTTSGCNDGVAQSTFREWSNGCCDLCVFQDNPQVCSDKRNLAWGHKIAMFADLFATEGLAALDYQGIQQSVQVPLTSVLDADIWSPDLKIPEKWRIERDDDEMLVFHSVGNFDHRSKGNRNIKGTHAIVEAVKRLRDDGLKVQLEFRTGMRNIDLRFIQAQCDVIIDQIVFGRYGSTAREGMMLGKPVVCRIDPSEPDGREVPAHLLECPIVNAEVDTIYSVLKDLYFDPERRTRLGKASRKFALKWHSKEAGAARFEEVYDRIMSGQSVSS